MTITIKQENNTWTATLCGRLDTVNAADFEKEIQPLAEHADQELILDCKELEYISSSGLRQFLTLRKTVAAQGGSLFITNINDQIREVFTITGFFSLFNIRP